MELLIILGSMAVALLCAYLGERIAMRRDRRGGRGK
jgi:hypothetical protein